MSEATSTSVNPVEQWRPVVGWEQFYSVSNYGQVRRDAPPASSSCCNTYPGKILKPRLNRRCRWEVTLNADSRRRAIGVHVLVAEAFHAPRPPGVEVNHLGHHQDNRAWMLEWLTRLENIRHAWRTGRKHGMPGEKNPFCKLTEDDVRVIRDELAKGAKLNALGRRFGVTYQAISHIRDRRNWPNVA